MDYNFTPEQSKFLDTVTELYTQNYVMSRLKVFETCGVPHDVAYNGDSAELDEHIPFEKGSDEYGVFMSLANTIDKRDLLASEQIYSIPNLYPQLELDGYEQIYLEIKGVMPVSVETPENGVEWTDGPVPTQELPSLTTNSPELPIENTGTLLLTDKSLIMIAPNGEPIEQISDIYEKVSHHILYNDGLIINLRDGQQIILKFTSWQNWEDMEVSDGVNQYAIVYDRMVKGNYNEDLDNLF